MIYKLSRDKPNRDVLVLVLVQIQVHMHREHVVPSISVLDPMGLIDAPWVGPTSGGPVIFTPPTLSCSIIQSPHQPITDNSNNNYFIIIVLGSAPRRVWWFCSSWDGLAVGGSKHVFITCLGAGAWPRARDLLYPRCSPSLQSYN